jgi:putative DNA modification/repair radical SAM protein
MGLRVKLAILADAAKYDVSCASSGSRRQSVPGGLGNTQSMGICHSFTPDGRCVSLLKILLTNHCIYDCQYCVNRSSSDVPRARFTVAEVVHLTLEFYRRNYIEGLFLSSGIIQNVDYTMEQLVAVARTLRLEHQYNGYIHLKTIPGASDELLAEAGQYADRLSANIELPTQADLRKLAPEKSLEQVHEAMGVIRDRVEENRSERRKRSEIKPPPFAPAGQSTQMIVGATPTPDAVILSTASSLYANERLRRVYYSAFSPIPHADDRLPVERPPLLREHRLYQADWLMRFYGFDARELTTAAQPDLPLDIDPKLAWALRNRSSFPVDVNRAPKHALLRVPGIGARNVDRILSLRRLHRIRLDDLARLRVVMRKARPFVITADHNPAVMKLDADDLLDRVAPRDRQMELFATAETSRTGEI